MEETETETEANVVALLRSCRQRAFGLSIPSSETRIEKATASPKTACTLLPCDLSLAVEPVPTTTSQLTNNCRAKLLKEEKVGMLARPKKGLEERRTYIDLHIHL